MSKVINTENQYRDENDSSWLGLRREGKHGMWEQVPGHVGLEEQFVPKGSIRVHIKCDSKGDLEMENGNSDLK